MWSFDSFDNGSILTTTVDNSLSTVETNSQGENKYVCGNTEDKVYLLSYLDYKTTYNGYINASLTDYAKCQGGKQNSYYLTRSPHHSSDFLVTNIENSSFKEIDVIACWEGIRPGITLNIKS